MTAKAYLGQARFLDMRIKSKIQQIESLNELATSCTAALSDMPRNPNKGRSRVEDCVMKILELQESLQTDIDRLVELKKEIMGTVKAVEDVELQALLEKRYWICRSKKETGVTCTSRNYSEGLLERISASILGMDGFDAEAFEAQVKTMLVQPDGSIEFHLVGNEVKTWKDLHLNDSRHVLTSTDAFLGKIRCALCGNTYHRVIGKKWVYWYCMGKKKKGSSCSNINFSDYHLRLISSYVMGTDGFDENAFSQQVREIMVLDGGQLEYHFSDGRVVTWEKA